MLLCSLGSIIFRIYNLPHIIPQMSSSPLRNVLCKPNLCDVYTSFQGGFSNFISFIFLLRKTWQTIKRKMCRWVLFMETRWILSTFLSQANLGYCDYLVEIQIHLIAVDPFRTSTSSDEEPSYLKLSCAMPPKGYKLVTVLVKNTSWLFLLYW